MRGEELRAGRAGRIPVPGCRSLDRGCHGAGHSVAAGPDTELQEVRAASTLAGRRLFRSREDSARPIFLRAGDPGRGAERHGQNEGSVMRLHVPLLADDHELAAGIHLLPVDVIRSEYVDVETAGHRSAFTRPKVPTQVSRSGLEVARLPDELL